MILQIHSDDLEQQATIWAERQADGLSEQDAQLLRQWLEADSRHRRAFADARTEAQRVLQLAQALVRAPAQQSLPVRAAIALDQPPSGRQWFKPLLGVAASLLAAVMLMQPDYRTGTGEIETLQLSDGSSLTLNAGTRVDVDFTEHERRVRLRSGELYVDVAHNPARPFIVETDQGEARAVGTAYAVQALQDKHQVIVAEGVVAVRTHTHADVADVVANQSVQLGQKLSPVTARSAEEVAQVLGWREQRLYFSNVALAEFVNEMNRYSHHKMFIADGSLSALRVGGAFSTGDTEGALAMLEAGFDVQVVQVTPWFALLYPASKE